LMHPPDITEVPINSMDLPNTSLKIDSKSDIVMDFDSKN
jgi:hypothetical protein